MDQDAGFHVDPAQTLLEASQCFAATSERTDKLAHVLTRCIYILMHQHQIAPAEATDLFFNVTRLFQYKNKDSTLRKLTHLAVKLLAKQAANVYVVTSSLTNNISSTRDEPSVRASALRALCQISDKSTFASIETFVRQSLLDNNPVIVSAAIASLVRIALTDPDLVRFKYSAEIEGATKSASPMVQYHALGLQYCLCKSQQTLVSKMITDWMQIHHHHQLQQQQQQQPQQTQQQSDLAVCLLIKIISTYITETTSNHEDTKSNENIKLHCHHIRTFLNHKSKMVQYEAASALIKLKHISIESSLHKLAVSHLRNSLTSSKQALRYAAVRTLNELCPSSTRFWSIHRVSGVCKLHLLNKRYRVGDSIVGILDFTNSQMVCARYIIMLQCEEVQQYEVKQEFSLGLRQNDFMLTIPMVNTKSPVLHCVLSFLFYIADKNYSKTIFEDKSGTIELGPNELDTRLFSCDFPIAIYT